MTIALSIHPMAPHMAQEISVHIDGCEPGSTYNVSLETKDEEGVLWCSAATYEAQARTIDTSRDWPVSGSYSEADPTGLFWSLRPSVPDDRLYLTETKGRYGRPVFPSRREIPFVLRARPQGNVRGSEAVHRFPVQKLAPRVAVQPIDDGVLQGILYTSDRARSRPTVIIVPGSGGGVEDSFARALASCGMNVMSLALFNYPGCSDYHQSVNVGVLVKAASYISAAGGGAPFVMGISRGSEAVLLAAGEAPEAFSGVVALVPGNIVTGGWSPDQPNTAPPWISRGRKVPFLPLPEFPAFPDSCVEEALNRRPIAYAPFYQTAFENRTYQESFGVPVQNIKVPTLFVGAGDDNVWPSGWASAYLADEMVAAGGDAKALILKGAGHLLAPPNLPTTLSHLVYHPVEKIFLDAGGTPEASAKAYRQLWLKLLEFFGVAVE